MRRLASLAVLLLLAGCARNGQPGFQPMAEARRGQIELDPQEATKKLAEAMTAAGLPVTEVATREGFVATAWYDTAGMKPAGARPLGAGDVRIRAWVMPWKYGWSEITMEAVYRPVADPSLPERELERSVPFDHPARVKIREVMQAMGVTSTLAEADAPKAVLKPPIMDPGRLDRTGAKVIGGDSGAKAAPDAAGRDSLVQARVDTMKPGQDSVRPRRDSAIVFRPRAPGDTIHQPAQPVPARPDTMRVVPAPPTPAPAPGYAVQVAAAADAYTANEIASRLKRLGYEARIVPEDGRYKVRTQLYPARPDAAIALERLRTAFRDAFMVER